jgi:hypothetical protein
MRGTVLANMCWIFSSMYTGGFLPALLAFWDGIQDCKSDWESQYYSITVYSIVFNCISNYTLYFIYCILHIVRWGIRTSPEYSYPTAGSYELGRFSTYWLFLNYFNIAFAVFLYIQSRRFPVYTPYFES